MQAATRTWTRAARGAVRSRMVVVGIAAVLASGVAVIAPTAAPPVLAAPGAAPSIVTGTRVAAGDFHTCALTPTGKVRCWGNNSNGQLGLGDTADRGDEPGEMGHALPPVDLGTGRTATAIAAGDAHTCAIVDTGAVKCWGRGQEGQLGYGNTQTRGHTAATMGDNLPAVDLGTGRTAVAISAELNSTCAVLDNGAVKCWGVNDSGQLGLGDTARRGDGPGEMGDSLPPVDLGTGRTATKVSIGAGTACALLDDETVKCWGANGEGQLGQGDASTRGDGPGEMGDDLLGVSLGTGRTATDIAASGLHTCAVLDNGAVKCWGHNAEGQLGSGNTTSRGASPDQMGDNLPAVDLGTGRTATAIVARSRQTCAVLDNSQLKCWGRGLVGALGQGDTTNRGDNGGEMGDNLMPVALGTGRTVTMADGNNATTCAALDNAEVKCWGGGANGQLGLGDTNHRGDGPGEMGDDLPAVDLAHLAISKAADETSVAVGGTIHYHVTVTNDGANPLTGVTVADSRAPACDAGVGDLAVGEDEIIDCTYEPTIEDVGTYANTATADSDQTGASSSNQVNVTVLPPLEAVLTADETSVPLGGTIHYHLALTNTTSSALTGVTVTDTDVLSCAGPAADIAPGTTQTIDCAYPTTAADFPQHRHRSTVESDQTDPVTTNTRRVGVGAAGAGATLAAGHSHSCAILPSGRVKCWGDNATGQLGYGDTNHRGDAAGEMGVNLPVVDLGTGRTAVALTAGALHTCALLDNARVKCWGEASDGQLGYGDTTDRGDAAGEMGDDLPYVDLGAGRTAVAITAPDVNTNNSAGRHTCALLDNGEVKCWGLNSHGQLGLGDTARRGDAAGEMGDDLPPVDLGTGRTATAVVAAAFHTCAVLDNGAVKCWGASTVGELGLGDTARRGDGPGEMGDALPQVDLGAGRTVRSIAAGGAHTCVILDDDTLKCWGYNGFGGLGLGNTAPRGDGPAEMGDSLPAVDLGSGRSAVSVNAGTDFTCAVLDDSTTKCWGQGAGGALGHGSTTSLGDGAGEMGDDLLAVDLGADRSAVALAAGLQRTCALLDDGSVKCWGWGGSGALGYGDTVNRGDGPGEMGDALPAVDLGTLFLTVTPQESTVGFGGTIHYQVAVRNDGGTLRTGITLSAPAVPDCEQAVPDLAVGASHSFTCTHTVAQADTGSFANPITVDSDQTAPATPTPTTVSVPAPVEVVMSADETWVRPGEPIHYHVTVTSQSAVPLTGITVSDIAAPACAGPIPDLAPGAIHTVDCTYTPTGGEYPERSNQASVDADQLDPISSNSLRVRVGTAHEALEIGAGDEHTCALLSNHTVRCWGNGANGRLGSGNTSSIGDDETPASVDPVDLGEGRTATHLAVGAQHACAVLDDGAVRCWGNGANGRLGHGATTVIGDDEAPGSIGAVDVGAGRTAVSISAGLVHTCAVLDDGAVRCWGPGARLGYGNTGTIGDNETPGSVGPVDLGAGRTATRVVAGSAHTCAVLDDGSVRCWGPNHDGRLGYANTTTIGDNETPGSVGTVDLGAGRTAVELSSGGVGTTATPTSTDSTTCAVLDDGSVRCWGNATNGRLGSQSTTYIGNDETPGSIPPVDIGAGRTATAVTTGDNHSCVIMDDGQVRCWGLGGGGRLGYAGTVTVGDNEPPGSAGPVDLGVGPGAPVLGVSVTAAEDEVEVGEPINLEVTVTNVGVPALSGLTLDVSAAPACEDPVPDLSAGQHHTAECTYTPTPGEVGTLTFAATADSAETDPVSSDPVEVTVTAPPGSGVVSGTLTETGTGTPVEGAFVSVLSAADFSAVGVDTTDGSGRYAIAVAPGDYWLYLIDPTGAHRSGFAGAPDVATVTAGSTVVIDGSLPSARATVTGTVRQDGTGDPLADVAVMAIDLSAGGPGRGAFTGGDGGYSLSSLSPGPHLLRYVDLAGGHRPEFFDDPATVEDVDLVVLAGGETATADASLTVGTPPGGGAHLTGTVVEAGSGIPLADQVVFAVHASTFELAAGGRTGPDGSYALDVDPGDYKVGFWDPTGGHRFEWYDGQQPNDVALATTVTAEAGAPGVADATLLSSTGGIAGTVTEAGSGGGVDSVLAVAIAPTGVIVGAAFTTPGGHYAIGGIPAGAVRVRFVDLAGTYRSEYHSDAPDYDGATPIVISPGHTSDVDAALEPTG